MNKNNQYNYQQAQRSNQTTGFKQPLPKQYTKHKKNLCDNNEIQLRCLICESAYYFAQNCPEARNQDTFFSQEVLLFQADYDHPAKLKDLVAESRNSAMLDSGASNTVTGESWMNTYIESLDDQDKAKIVFRESTNVYRFGDSKTIPATRNTDIPVVIGSKQFTLNTDAVPNDIPLLLSKKSIETANMTLDFKNDNAILFGEPELLIVTRSGHYPIPISP